MYNFFLTISLIVIALLFILVYYAFKNSIQQRRKTRMARETWQKIYDDEERYIRTKLRMFIHQLAVGNIQWIIVHSKLNPQARFELTFNTIQSLVEIVCTGNSIGQLQRSKLYALGADTYVNKAGNIIIQCAVNAKIIADILYYVLHDVYTITRVRGLIIKVSGRTNG